VKDGTEAENICSVMQHKVPPVNDEEENFLRTASLEAQSISVHCL